MTFGNLTEFAISCSYYDACHETELSVFVKGDNILAFERNGKLLTTLWDLDDLVLWLKGFIRKLEEDPYPVNIEGEYAAEKDLNAHEFDSDNDDEFDMINIKKYQMKYMFDWGSGTCLWSTNGTTIEKYDYPVDIKDLPISEDLHNYLDYLIDKHDEALNWDDPAGDLLWTEEQQKVFTQKALKGYERLCDELRDKYEISLFHSMI